MGEVRMGEVRDVRCVWVRPMCAGRAQGGWPSAGVVAEPLGRQGESQDLRTSERQGWPSGLSLRCAGRRPEQAAAAPGSQPRPWQLWQHRAARQP